jgi:hypothetical protein
MYTQTHDVDELVAQANGNGATAKAEPLTQGKSSTPRARQFFRLWVKKPISRPAAPVSSKRPRTCKAKPCLS